MIPRDKQLHLAAGAVAALLGAVGAQLLGMHIAAGACTACAAAAFGREAFNRWRPAAALRTGWDWLDIAYTLAGGAPVFALATL